MGWLGTWAHRLKIVIDKDDIDAALSNFPILLYLSSSSGIASRDITEIFDELGANHLKIAVTSDDGTTELYVEVEYWSSGDELAWLWVKVPSVAHDVDTVLYLYFDNNESNNTTYIGIPSDAVVHNVWDSNYKLVSHMRDDPDTSSIRDSSVEANDGAKKGANEPLEATSILAEGQDFDAVDDIITIDDDAALNPSTAITIRLWAKMGPMSDEVPYKQRATRFVIRDDCYGILHGYNQPFVFYASFHFDDATSVPRYGQWVAFDEGSWYLLTATYDAATGYIKVYRNKVKTEVEVDGHPDLDVVANDVKLGGAGRDGDFMNDVLDEVRISNIARSDAWIYASYESEIDHLITWNKDFTVLVEDGIDVSDEVSTGFKKLLEDGIETTDVISKISAFKKLLLDTANVEDTLAKVTAFKKLLEDTVEVSSDLTIIKIYLVLLEDTIEVSDSLTKVTSFKKLLQDTINIADELIKSTSFHKVLTDSIESASAFTTKLTLKPLEDTIEVSSALIKISSFKKTLEDAIEVADEISTVSNFYLILEDGVQVSELLTKATIFKLELLDAINMLDELTKAVQFHKTFEDTVEVSDTLAKVVSFKKELTDAIEITDELTKATTFYKTLNDQVLVIDELVKVSTFHKLLTDQITVEDWLQVRQLMIAATIKLLLARKTCTLTLADKSALLILADKLSSLSLVDKEAIIKLVNKTLELRETNE